MKVINVRKRGGNKVMFVEMSKREALETIKSLATQLAANNPNVGRYESYCEDGSYFSIAVVEEEEG